MAIETLHASLREAAAADGLVNALPAVQEVLRPKLTRLGSIRLKGHSFAAYDSATASFDPEHPDLARGGTRIDINGMDDRASVGMVNELAEEMGVKEGGMGEVSGGRKGLIALDHKPDGPETVETMRQYADLMFDAGLAHPFGRIISSDMNTGGFTKFYAERIHEREPGMRKWRATAAGKDVKTGGLAIRPEATAIGVLTSLDTLMQHDGIESASVVVKGFGQVGARSARRASQLHRNLAVKGIADMGGTVWTEDPEGLAITDEMVAAFGDNTQFKGDKMDAFMSAHAKLRPGVALEFDADPNTSLYLPTDYLIPAAGPNDITLDRASRLGARLGIIEAANGPTESEAHAYLVAKGLRIVSDTVANRRGVACSRLEWEMNMADGSQQPDAAQMEQRLISEHRADTQEILDTADRLRNNDLRMAAGVVTIHNIVHLARIAA